MEEIKPLLNAYSFVDELNKEIAHGSHRSLGLVAGSFLDQLLSAHLREVLKGGNTRDGILKPGGLLGSLDAKVKILYCLGMISLNERSAINKLQNIRNLCAHLPEVNFFEDPINKPAKDFVKMMKVDDGPRRDDELVHLFTMGSILLLARSGLPRRLEDIALREENLPWQGWDTVDVPPDTKNPPRPEPGG